MAHGWHGQAPPVRVAVEEAPHHGRSGIDTDSEAAPRLDPRPRREVPSHRRRSRENARPPMSLDGGVLRVVMGLHADRPCIEVLYRRYGLSFGQLGRPEMAKISVRPVKTDTRKQRRLLMMVR